ncbi:hypothetical protein IWX81_001292 [Salinibacterium sp. CAN_S4]|uniref:hypothetical protein n=1 Tax=Salinibacterium sp. CAN_S4 TaxID=2787727 RepID=UPI0018F0169D
MSTLTSGTRAGQLAEKVILGMIAGGAAAIGVVDTVFLVGRIIRLASGPAELTGVPTTKPLDAGFASATFDTVTLTVAELSAGGRAFLIGAAVLTWLLVIGICAVVAWLCVRVFHGKPFGAAATWGIGAVSLLVILSGLGTPTLNGMAAQRALVGLDLEQFPMFLVTVDLAPLGWGLALAVVAGAFEIGQRMQRETGGLV